MLLEEALEMYKNSKWKIDILELLWIEIRDDFCEEDFYKQRAKKLPKWKYFISDLDWTFFRWTLIKEAFSLFVKYFKSRDILDLDLEKYTEFLTDLKLFRQIEKEAFNKSIAYNDYLNAGLFLIYKYHKQIDWQDYLSDLKYYFHKKEKVNPYRFSMEKIKEIVKDWNYFIFVSWASNFVFEIYLELLKNYISKNLWKKYAENIYGFSSYENLEKNYVYNLWNMWAKDNFIKQLKKAWFLGEIIWWMWDTSSDFGIANNLKENTPFYFINPAKSVLTDFHKLAKSWVNYHFLAERKDLIFEFKKEDIKIMN